MVVTKRTKSSLSQFLSLFNSDVIQVLLDKHNISCWGYGQVDISSALASADNQALERPFDEIVRTTRELRNRVSPRYRFDEHWQDLEKCLLLDCYRIEKHSIISIEPFIESSEPIEDDLTKELRASCLPASEKIVDKIGASSEAFIKTTPDYNGCLVHARIALETLVRSIAEEKGFQSSANSKAWGLSLAYLANNGFINKKEECAISSVYTFISDGAHVPLGFTAEEFARLGRNLVTSVCYFIIKRFNANNNV